MESSTLFRASGDETERHEGIVKEAEPTGTAAGGVLRVAAEHVVRQHKTFVAFSLGELSEFAHDRAVAADVAQGHGNSEMHGRFLFGWLLVSRYSIEFRDGCEC